MTKTADEALPSAEHITALEHRVRVLESVLGHVNQGISFFSEDLRLEACNRRYLDLLGFPAELGEIGTPFEQFIAYNAGRGEYGPGDPAEQVRVRVEAARQHNAHRFERTRPGDGTTLEIIGTPVDGGGFVTTYADITERKRHERLIAESQHRLELALDAAGLGLWDWDLASNELKLCERFLRMVGDDAHTLTSWEMVSVRVHPDDVAGIQARLHAHLDGASAGLEVEYRVRDGSDTRWIWLHIRGRVVARDETGRALRMIGTALDISERKSTEALLLSREQRLAMLVKSIQDLIFVVDTGGCITEYWPAPAFDLGLDAAAVAGKPYADVLPAPMVDGLSAAVIEVITGAASHTYEFSLPVPGGEQHYQVTTSQLADSSKYATGCLVLVRDITEVRRLYSALAEAQSYLAGQAGQ